MAWEKELTVEGYVFCHPGDCSGTAQLQSHYPEISAGRAGALLHYVKAVISALHNNRVNLISNVLKFACKTCPNTHQDGSLLRYKCRVHHRHRIMTTQTPWVHPCNSTLHRDQNAGIKLPCVLRGNSGLNDTPAGGYYLGTSTCLEILPLTTLLEAILFTSISSSESIQFSSLPLQPLYFAWIIFRNLL